LPESRWRREARSTIVIVVKACRTEEGCLPADILARVDAAYPFGERRYHPYKAWLKERRLFIAALDERPMPTADEVATCEVARDAVEDGRDPQLIAALLAQAPNRLARKCGACGARAGEPCLDLTLPIEFLGTEAMKLPVPHQARLVGHLDVGPLFTARST
jgi:hypothetical protein